MIRKCNFNHHQFQDIKELTKIRLAREAMEANGTSTETSFESDGYSLSTATLPHSRSGTASPDSEWDESELSLHQNSHSIAKSHMKSNVLNGLPFGGNGHLRYEVRESSPQPMFFSQRASIRGNDSSNGNRQMPLDYNSAMFHRLGPDKRMHPDENVHETLSTFRELDGLEGAMEFSLHDQYQYPPPVTIPNVPFQENSLGNTLSYAIDQFQQNKCGSLNVRHAKYEESLLLEFTPSCGAERRAEVGAEGNEHVELFVPNFMSEPKTETTSNAGPTTKTYHILNTTSGRVINDTLRKQVSWICNPTTHFKIN